MNEPVLTDRWILGSRGKKNPVDPRRPYGWMIEKERTASGNIEDTGIIFLTNAECPFHCLMCDLWKNTTDSPQLPGSIPTQLKWALEQMPGIKHLKLYNSGSFFDTRAVPLEDYTPVAALLKGFETVIVESHPRFIGEKTLLFRNLLKAELQVAIGLETSEDSILQKLNKKMTPQDFSRAVSFLSVNGIGSRAFILLKPPFLDEEEAVLQAERSLDYAFKAGIECCVIIPVRPGNGAIDLLLKKGLFELPSLHSLEKVLEYGIKLKTGRVFADTWDLKLFSTCDHCLGQRVSRITAMNLMQTIPDPVSCHFGC